MNIDETAQMLTPPEVPQLCNCGCNLLIATKPKRCQGKFLGAKDDPDRDKKFCALLLEENHKNFCDSCQVLQSNSLPQLTVDLSGIWKLKV